jgi:hypothetical protein
LSIVSAIAAGTTTATTSPATNKRHFVRLGMAIVPSK